MVRDGADPLSDENASELSRFFDHLVDLIPAKYYHDETTERLDLRYMKKAARAEAKASFKVKRKEGKLAKLDPDEPSTALEVQQAKIKGQKPESGAQEGKKTAAAPAAMVVEDMKLPATINFGNSASREELKERLAKKIESARQLRQAKEKAEAAKKAKEWKQKTLTDNVKQKRGEQKHEQKLQGSKRKAESLANGDSTKKAAAPAAVKSEPASGVEPQFAFPRIDVSDGRASVIGPKGKKKPTKADLLKQAEAKQKQMQELAGTADGKAQLKAEAWKSALNRATGEKVLDDPKLLRRSLKKEAKSREKATKGWKERQWKEKDAKEKKQTKRTTNLKIRSDAKIQKKKDKREKKLLRAGFEGRKEGFIGKGGDKA